MKLEIKEFKDRNYLRNRFTSILLDNPDVKKFVNYGCNYLTKFLDHEHWKDSVVIDSLLGSCSIVYKRCKVHKQYSWYPTEKAVRKIERLEKIGFSVSDLFIIGYVKTYDYKGVDQNGRFY